MQPPQDPYLPDAALVAATAAAAAAAVAAAAAAVVAAAAVPEACSAAQAAGLSKGRRKLLTTWGDFIKQHKQLQPASVTGVTGYRP